MKLRVYTKYSFALALITFLLNEIFSRERAGVPISLALFIVLVVYIMLKKNHIFSTIFILSFLILEFPRDVLLNYTNYEFYTLKSVKVGPGTLYLYISLIALFVGLIKYPNLNLIVFGFFISSVSTFGTFMQALSNSDINIGLLLTNYKLIIFSMIGAVYGYNYMSRYGAESAINKLMRLVLTCSLAAAIRVYFIVPLELYRGSFFIFDLSTQPLYLLASMLYVMNSSWPIYSYMGLFTTSRAEIIFIALSLILNGWHKALSINTSKLIIVSLVVLSGFYFLIHYLPFLFDFLLWKISQIELFGGEPSGSSLVRRYELLNILCEMSRNPHQILFGGGLSATYNFECFPLPSGVILDEKSFSYDQIVSNSFYGVHTTPAALLLRFGLLGLAIFLFFGSISIYRISKLRVARIKKIALVLTLVFSAYYFHSQPHAQIVYGFMVTCLIMRSRKTLECSSIARESDLAPNSFWKANVLPAKTEFRHNRLCNVGTS